MTVNWNGTEILVQAPRECEIAVRKKADKEYLFVLNFDKEEKEIVLQKDMTGMDTGEVQSGSVAL